MKCWYCGKAEMVDTDDGFHPFKKCPECGATWCNIPILGPAPISGTWKDEAGFRHYKVHLVSKKRKAKK